MISCFRDYRIPALPHGRLNSFVFSERFREILAGVRQLADDFKDEIALLRIIAREGNLMSRHLHQEL